MVVVGRKKRKRVEIWEEVVYIPMGKQAGMQTGRSGDELGGHRQSFPSITSFKHSEAVRQSGCWQGQRQRQRQVRSINPLSRSDTGPEQSVKKQRPTKLRHHHH